MINRSGAIMTRLFKYVSVAVAAAVLSGCVVWPYGPHDHWDHGGRGYHEHYEHHYHRY